MHPILKNSMKKIWENPVLYSEMVVCLFLNLLNFAKNDAMIAFKIIILVVDNTLINIWKILTAYHHMQ
jgi:hypothetical protein